MRVIDLERIRQKTGLCGFKGQVNSGKLNFLKVTLTRPALVV